MKDAKYIVNLNNKYRLYDTFLTKEDAKFQMFSIANARNELETELTQSSSRKPLQASSRAERYHYTYSKGAEKNG